MFWVPSMVTEWIELVSQGTTVFIKTVAMVCFGVNTLPIKGMAQFHLEVPWFIGKSCMIKFIDTFWSFRHLVSFKTAHFSLSTVNILLHEIWLIVFVLWLVFFQNQTFEHLLLLQKTTINIFAKVQPVNRPAYFRSRFELFYNWQKSVEFCMFFFFLVTKWHSNTAIPSHWPPNFFLLFLNLSLCWKVSQIHISSVLSNETPPIFSYQCVFKNNQPINRLSEFYSPKYHNQPKNVWFRSGPSFCQFSDRLRTEPGTES